MRTLIYLDESGDLGWSFDAPHLKGGSSRMLTIAAVSCPQDKLRLLTRIVRGLYKKRGRPLKHELKSVDLNFADRQFFIKELEKVRIAHPDIIFYSITVNKQAVHHGLRVDPNKLYNYMVRSLLLDEIINKRFVDLIPDARSEKVNTGWNLGHYLNQMIFERRVQENIINESCNVTPMESHTNLELQFIDYYAALVWAKYEYNSPIFDEFISQESVKDITLFFESP